jgi:hypothetical protein
MNNKFFFILIISIFSLSLFLGIKSVFASSALYQRCEPNVSCVIGEYIFADDGYTPITTDSYCQITITNPSESIIISEENMLDSNDGWYYWSTSTLATPEGMYRTKMCCDVGGVSQRCMDKTFVLGASFEGQKTTLDSTKLNTDLIRQATFDFSGLADAGSATSTLVDAELAEYPDDHWNNYEVVFLTGDNAGTKEVVCDFDRTTYTITLCDATTYTIDSGDKYIISHERKIAHAIWNWADRTITSLGALAADVWNDIYAPIRKLTSRQIGSETEYIAGVTATTTVIQISSQTQAENIYTDTQAMLTRIGESSDVTSSATVFGKIKEIRGAQTSDWKVYLSDFNQVLTGNVYRAKLFVMNYESVLTDAFATPTIVVYDASRNIVVENVSMTKVATGIYEYTYTVAGSATQGVWETEVSATVESGKIIKANDYWEVEGSPAQVLINSISDNSIPTISASVTVSNEGLSGYEYQYEWCIVSAESNACGGGDDTAYSSAAKYINAGTDWNTTLSATVSTAGSYWFKLIVYYGTEISGASLAFNAVVVATPTPTPEIVISGGGGGGSSSTPTPTPTVMEKITGAFCTIFPCETINNILSRLFGIETRASTLELRFTQLENRIIQLLSVAPASIQTQPQEKVIIRKPIESVPKSRAKIRLE